MYIAINYISIIVMGIYQNEHLQLYISIKNLLSLSFSQKTYSHAHKKPLH